MSIHKEGFGTLLTSILSLGILNALVYFFVDQGLTFKAVLAFSVVLFLIILQFFRSPNRTVAADNGKIIAPADGKVVVIENTQENEFFKDERIQVSIFMSPTNVHVNWSPIKGLIEYYKYHAGKYLVAWHPKSSEENERTTVVIKNDKVTILVRQIAGAMARRIVSYAKVGNALEQGEEIGFIKFGSRVDVFLPKDAKIHVALQQKVKGNRTIIASID